MNWIKGHKIATAVIVVLALAMWAITNAATSKTGQVVTVTLSPKTVSETVMVTYKLTGSATGADLTYTDGSGNIQQHAGAAVPLTHSGGIEGLSFTAHHGAFVSFMAQNMGENGSLDCAIEADGVVVNTGHSSGGYMIVSCSATLP